MKTKVIRPEVLNKHITSAILMVLRALYGIDKGMRVTSIQTEGEDLVPTGVQYRIHIDVQISGDPPDPVNEIKNTPS